MPEWLKRFVAFVNKHWTHVRDNDKDFGIRALQHIPAGFFMGFLDWDKGFNRLFIFYEKNEDRHTHDEAWKDVFGAMVGFVLGRVAIVALLTWLVWRLVNFLVERGII